MKLHPYHDPSKGNGTLLSREVRADLSKWEPITQEEPERILGEGLPSSRPRFAAVSGHAIESVETILNRYLVRTRALAEEACGKRLAWLGNQEQSMSPPAKKLDS